MPDHDPLARSTAVPRQHAILVGVALTGMEPWEAEDSLEELGRLTHTATLIEVGRLVQHRRGPDATFYVGRGKAEELKRLADERDADLLIFDNDLSPAQMRNLEQLTGVRILDRSGLILDIFARRARTRTAQIQVELAQLHYLLPRLTRQWTHLSRQAGGGAIRGMGAVGVRGPGETQLETDRRTIRRRIRELEDRLERIGTQLATSRQGRTGQFRVALVGYTNAGKSTLMRALSGADVLVEDQLFATLDSTTRQVDLGGHQQVLLTDTVGFIKRLPHHLFASFHATLEEAVEADLLLHVIDLSFCRWQSQAETVDGVLRQLGLEDHPTLRAYNKIDRIGPGEEAQVAAAFASQENAVALSAATGFGLDPLRQRLTAEAQRRAVTLTLQVPQSEGRLLAMLAAEGTIIHREFHDNEVRLQVCLNRTWIRRLDLDRFRVSG